MNYSYVCKNPLIIAIASLLLSASFVQAREIQLEVEPEKLTIAGTNKDKIKRTLVLVANKPISPANLEISFRELNSAKNVLVNLNEEENQALLFRLLSVSRLNMSRIITM